MQTRKFLLLCRVAIAMVVILGFWSPTVYAKGRYHSEPDGGHTPAHTRKIKDGTKDDCIRVIFDVGCVIKKVKKCKGGGVIQGVPIESIFTTGPDRRKVSSIEPVKSSSCEGVIMDVFGNTRYYCSRGDCYKYDY